MSNDNIKLVEFKSKQKQEEEKVDELVREAISECYKAINITNASGMFSLVFDKDGNPNILFAGNIDPFKIVGVLEKAKSIFLEISSQNELDIDFGDFDNNDTDR